jgi:integrase
MLNVKAAEDPESALLALWPRLQAVAVEPVKNETDYVERLAFQYAAFEVQALVRFSGVKPDAVAPGWDQHFVALVRENGLAGNRIEKNNTPAGRIERRREELFAQGADIVVPPPMPTQAAINPVSVAAAVAAALPLDGNRSRLSEVLKKFLDWREGEDGDRRATNDIAPIVQFAIDLWKDPCLGDIGPDQLVVLKKAMPEIPTPAGFLVDVRSLFQRWTIAKANDYVVNNNGKTFKLVRVSASTHRKRYRSGLNVFWAFLIENLYVPAPAPDFSSISKQNPPAVERDAFEPDELLKFLTAPLFTGCAGVSRTWVVGEYFCQNYFYWTVLIQLLCGLRPGEISQLRCADIALLYGEWHFRFAKRSLADGEGEENGDHADTEPGGNAAKTKNAFRWVPVHPLLDQLGILKRRDAVVADFIKGIPPSPTTPAATGTARSARAPPPRNGSPTARPTCCRCRTITWCSPCQGRTPTSPTRTRGVYDLLFKVSAETMLTIAADPKHLGARIGITSVLHTWGSALTHHPHLHMIVPGGGISPDRQHWVSCRPGFFLPVRVLSRLFRRLFLQKLLAAHQASRLKFFGEHTALADAQAFAAYLAPLRRAEWVVYSKRPFGGPEAVLSYLSRYTHRVAISNSRLISLDDAGVTFKWKDYRAKRRERQKIMTLAVDEFIHRFLIHVLPKGFHRIRHYGLFAKGSCADNIARARELLAGASCLAASRSAVSAIKRRRIVKI